MPPAPPFVFRRGEFRSQTVHYRIGHLLLKVHSRGDDRDEVISVIREVMHDSSVRSEFRIVAEPVGRWAYIRLNDPDTDLLNLVKDLDQDSRVWYAEPDLKMVFNTAGSGPDDPKLYEGEGDYQWGIDFINLFDVWEEDLVGDDSVLIGLIDSGIPLKGNESNSPGRGMPLVDVDGNDLVDHLDLDGTRFLAGNDYAKFDPPLPWPHDNDAYHHGTNMAGIIAAKEDNGIGIAGVNWGSPVYVTVASDFGSESSVGNVILAAAEILSHAAENNFPHVVINLSANQTEQVELDSMIEMMEMIVEAGAIICISAGKGYVGESGVLIQQPAMMWVENPDFSPHVIVVGGVDKNGAIYHQSGRGIKEMVFAPGVRVVTTDKNNTWEWEDGASIATAHVSGLAALLWGVDHGLLATEVVKCIKNTCRKPAETGSEPETEPEDLGHGIVNALDALGAIRGTAELLTPCITFEDIEPGLDHEKEIKIQVTSCRETTFTVTVDSTGHDFGIIPGSYHHDSCGDDPFILVATYNATAEDSASGSVTVVWDQRPDYRWEIQITANRTVRRKALCLVLDKSGSMASSSGMSSYTRLEVLKFSAEILVDLIDPGNGLGIVGFDSEAHELAPFTLIDPADPEAGRTALKSSFEDLAAGGLTSIAAGIRSARDGLDALADDDTKAIIVLTDGKETHEPWLAELIAEGFPYPVFAIGMGSAASLQPEALDLLANNTDGYCVLTGELDESTQNAVAEFLSQILTEISGPAVPSDPTQRLGPGAVQRFPLILSEADKEVEVILLRSPFAPLEISVLDPGSRPVRSRLVSTERMVRVRFPGPAAYHRPGFNGNGTWHVEVSMNRDRFPAWLAGLQYRGMDTSRMEMHGTYFTFRAHALSNLRMKCRTSQSGYTPGSTLFLKVILTDRGRPLPWRSSLTAQLIDPAGEMRNLRLRHRGNGHYETSFEAVQPGIYIWKITADGKTRAGQSFRREYRLTGAVWNQVPGGLPRPQAGVPTGRPSAWLGPR